MCRDGLAMVEPPPPPNPLKADDFGQWETELHKLIKNKGYEVPEMYCLADRVKGKYLQPYREEKDPGDQSAVNTIRVMVDGEPVAIGEYLPRLKAVIAPTVDRIYYYVPKELRDEAKKLSKRLKDAMTQSAEGTA